MANEAENGPLNPEIPPQPNPSSPQPQAAPQIIFGAPPPGLGAPFILPQGGIGSLAMGLAIQQQSWQAPYPPPDAAERFEKILPGFLDRVLTMVETGQKENAGSIKTALTSAANDTRRAHYLGFISNLCAMLGALACLKLQYPYVACVFLSVPAVAVGKALVDSTMKAAGDPSPVALPQVTMPTIPVPISPPPPTVN